MEKEFTVEPTGLYTIQQTANYLGVSRVTINNWCKRHDSTRLPYEINKMNGRKLFKGAFSYKTMMNINTFTCLARCEKLNFHLFFAKMFFPAYPYFLVIISYNIETKRYILVEVIFH